ncbi:MAG: serine/threonine protein kinase [Anaerolineae bacterium]|jgi:serine/threonine-protein kinase|nr:serine/threonine protein kinase [Anaerolineae bacterium]
MVTVDLSSPTQFTLIRHPYRRVMARIGWLVIVGTLLLLYVSALPNGLRGALADPLSSLPYQTTLTEMGLSPDLAGGLLFAQSLILVIFVVTICIFMFFSRSDNWMVLFVTFEEILYAVQHGSILGYTYPVLFALLRWLSLSATFALLFLFPNGRFYPRWMWILLLIGTISGVVLMPAHIKLVAPDHPWAVWDIFEIRAASVFLYMVIGFFALGMQIRRYRRVATPIERQQSKWVLIALAFIGINGVAALIVELFLPRLFVPALGMPLVFSAGEMLLFFLVNTLELIASLVLPLAIAFSILRYRLWDVDLLINRSLVYGSATLALMLIYGAAFLLLASLVTGPTLWIALLITAMMSTALFDPLRKQLQQVIDRRLYRFRFDLDQAKAANTRLEIKFPGSLSGKTLHGYQITDLIGRGGMGEVYKGHKADQWVAIKVLPPELAYKEKFRLRFQREAEATQALKHPNIVPLLDRGESGELTYLILDYIDGIELGEYLVRYGAFSVKEAIAVFTQLADAVDHTHACGFIHRDLKPSNILIRLGADQQRLEPILVDFGIVKPIDAVDADTASGPIGTLHYMAPEQILTLRTVDQRADVYALGVILFEMLTGRPPFIGTAGQVLFAHIQQPAPDIRTLNDSIPSPIAHAIARALLKNAEDRFDSAGQFAAALDD